MNSPWTMEAIVAFRERSLPGRDDFRREPARGIEISSVRLLRIHIPAADFEATARGPSLVVTVTSTLERAIRRDLGL